MNSVVESNSVVTDMEEYGLRPEASKFPMMLVLSVAYPCNALCPHCPYTNSTIRKEYRDAPFMPSETFRKIADEAGPHGAYLRLSGGGEPMLHEDAVELMQYAKEKGCKIGLITNGSLFDRESLRALVEAEVDLIEFSVDACDEPTYDIVRKGLDWGTLVENVKIAVEERNKARSSTKIIASAVNQVSVDIDAVEKFWVEDIGVDYLIKRKFLTWGLNTSLDDGRSADPAAYLNTDEVPCPFLFERLNIDSRGNVMVCGYDISANTRMGNVTTESIADIWHGEGFQWYREKHLSGTGKEISLCSQCPDWQYRSWTHNYWKVVKNAEENRQMKIARLDENEDFGVAVET
jgi:radical SAM protein with 4Fe4S-binding SPASM domain